MPQRHSSRMDLRQLRYFVAAIEEGSLQAAAERMNVAQPALSRRVRDLEAGLGCDLLVRGARGVAPTRAGTTLYREALLLLDRLDQAERHTRRAATGGDATVRVGLVITARKYAFVQQALIAHARRATEAGPVFTRGASSDLTAALRDGRLDMSLLYERHLGDAGFGERMVHHERYVLAVHPEHPLAAPGPLTIARLSGEPLVWLSRRDTERDQDQLMQQCRLHGLEPVIGQTAHSHDEQIDLTVVATGMCLTPASTILSVPPAMLRFRPLPEFAMELSLGLAWNRQTKSSSAQELLRHFHHAIDTHQHAIGSGLAGWSRLDGIDLLRAG